MKDFNPYTRQTRTHIWIRLMVFPHEYLCDQTLFEIYAIGTPIHLDTSN